MMRAPTRLSRYTPRALVTRPALARPARVALWTIALEAMLLVGLGVSAIGGPREAPGRPRAPATEVVGLELTRAHGLLLVVTGLVALAALRHPAWRFALAIAQTAGYLLITVLGVLLPRTPWWQLNLADHLLHAVLCLLGATLWLLLRAVGPVRGTRHETTRAGGAE